MSEQQAGARPSQVTVAGWVAIAGSVLLILTLFDTTSRLHTVKFREGVEELLTTPPWDGLGLTTAEVVEVMRVLMLFSGAAAAVTAVLGFYVLQRNNAARVGYTVAAVAVVLTSPAGGSGFLPVMIAFAAFMLWTKPARDWFAGIPATASASGRSPGAHAGPRVKGTALSSENHPPQGPTEGEGARPEWPRMPQGTPEGEEKQGPAPTQGFGSAGQPGPGQQAPPPGQPGHMPYPPYAQPPQGPQYGQPQQGQTYPPQYGQAPYPYVQQPYVQQPYYGGYTSAPVDPDKRPSGVAVAAGITWVLSGLTMLGFLLMAFVMVAAKDEFLEQVQQDQNFQDLNVNIDDVVAAIWVLAAVILLWSVAAMVIAWFAYRRANWARITLVVSAAVAALVSLVTFPVGILHTAGTIAVIVLLFVGGANDWYSRRPVPGGQGGPGGFLPYGDPSSSYGQPGQPGQYGQPGQQGQPGEYGQTGDKGEPPKNVW